MKVDDDQKPLLTIEEQKECLRQSVTAFVDLLCQHADQF